MRHSVMFPEGPPRSVISGGTGPSGLISPENTLGITTAPFPEFSSPALKRFAPSMLPIVRPFSEAKTSTGNSLFTSVAVVRTGVPPVNPAARTAYLFASPRCPDRTGMQKAPFSSIDLQKRNPPFPVDNLQKTAYTESILYFPEEKPSKREARLCSF